MSGEMFGAPIGEVAYDQNQFTRAKTQETLGEVAMQPAKTRLLGAQADKLEHEAAFDKLMASSQGLLGQQAADGKPVSMAESFDRLARIAAGGGFITKAEDLAKTGALLRTRDATALKAQVDTRLGQIKLVRDNAELTSQLLGGVNDEASWRRANALYEFQTGQPSQFAGLAYSPEMVQQLNQAALNAKERADLEEKRLTRQATEAYRNKRLGQIDTQNGIRERRLQQQKERDERLAKNGGKGVTSPAKGELDQAIRLIKKDYDGLEAGDLNDAAFSIASDARALRRANPALDPNTALQQAYANAVEAKDFDVLPKATVAGFDIGKKVVYQGRGKSQAAPIGIPAGTAGKEALAKVPEGRYVRSATGQLGVKTKNGVRLLSADNGRLDTAAADDTEDDDAE